MLCRWRYVSGGSGLSSISPVAFCFYVIASSVCRPLEKRPIVLIYHVSLLSVMARYDGKIMRKDRSELVVTCGHSPITILMATENTTNVTRSRICRYWIEVCCVRGVRVWSVSVLAADFTYCVLLSYDYLKCLSSANDNQASPSNIMPRFCPS